MISTDSFSKDWIVRRSEELGYNNKQLLEKVIRAFALLEMLVDAGAPMVFKGGSSLLLILKDSLNRLSIDVDVICPPGTDIRAYLKNLEAHGFVSIVPVRTEHGGKDLPASHFKSFYELAFGGGGEDEAFIRLDVLYEDNPYDNTQFLPIDSPFLLQAGEPLKVRVPSKEDILGDKLTAFGPNTLGIPYYKEDRAGEQRRCSLEIIKQLFDIGRLFDAVEDFTGALASFRKVSQVELSYRKMEGQLDSYYEDVRESALCGMAGWMHSNGVSIPQAEQAAIQQIFSDYLSQNRIALKADFAKAVQEKGIAMDEQRLSYHIRLAEYSGLLCSGDLFPMKASYALVEDKLPRQNPIPRDEALALLARKYFRSHGPATLEDFVWWTGLNISDCKSGMDAIQSELIGYKSRHVALHPDHTHRAHNSTGNFWPVILLDGQVVGNWSAPAGKLRTEVFHPEAGISQEVLQEEISKYQMFLNK